MKKLLFVLMVVVLSSSILMGMSYLTILHVNDTHGRSWPIQYGAGNHVGGWAAMSTLIDEIRAEVKAYGGHVLVMHAGDFNTGVPESDQLDAIPDIVGMNMIGFDAVVLGNHEFDKDRDVLNRQMALLQMPVISANLFDENNENPVTPYIIRDFGDFRVAVYGLTTKDTEVLEPIYLDTWWFEDEVKLSQALVPQLKEEADLVVALAHIGYGVEGRSGGRTSNEVAAGVNGLDIIIDGHSHTLMREAVVINDTIIAQAGEHGKYMGRLDLVIHEGEIVHWEWTLLPINVQRAVTDSQGNQVLVYEYKPIPQDPKVKAVMDYFMALGGETLNQVIGETAIFLDGERGNVRSTTTNLGNLITDGMRWRADADIAFQNGGGIRASIQAGPITYRDVLTVQPFGNTLFVIPMTGAEIKELAEIAAAIPAGQGAFLHFSGLTFVVENAQVKDLKVDGVPLDLNKTYRAVTNNYVAMGGDGFNNLKAMTDAGRGYDTYFSDAFSLGEYIQHLGLITDYDDSHRMLKK